MNKKILTLTLTGLFTLGAVGTVVAGSPAQNALSPSKNLIVAAPKISESVEEKEYTLSLNYDQEKYKLFQFEDKNGTDETLHLMENSDKPRRVYVSVEHLESTSMEEAAKEEVNKINSFTDSEGNQLAKGTKTESDLDMDSIKVLDTGVEDGYTLVKYFIDDKNGGSYRLMINGDKDEILKGIDILPLEENEDIMKNGTKIEVKG